MKVDIRPVQEKEIPVLTQLAIETFVTAFGKYNAQEDMRSYLDQSLNPDAVYRQFHDPQSRFYFAMLENEPIGYLKINFGNAQTDVVLENAMEIERIYVHKKYQGQKIGLQLFDFAVMQAQIEQIEWIWLGVWEYNEGALKFYRKIGLEAFDKHTFTLGNDVQTDILMRIKVGIN